jgi:ADP-heptose:LPS heptosyltransferase
VSTAVAARSRFHTRAEVVARALAARVTRSRKPPVAIRRVLLAHHLLLGDTLMLTPLVAKLRARYPEAEIVMTVPRAIAPLYSTHPYGIRALPWDPRHANSALFTEDAFDLGLVPGDNRYAWLAAAMHSRWIVAFSGDPNERRNWPIDELRPYPDRPAAWGDMVATLVDGPRRCAYKPTDWPAPMAAPFARPAQPTRCCMSAPHAAQAGRRTGGRARGMARGARLAPVWSARPGKANHSRLRSEGHTQRMRELELPQLWHLLAGARLLVAPDTGVAHLARVVGVPTVAIFGPGSAVITGAGDFWRDAPYRAVTVDPFPCRDQRILFRREIEWVRRCGRTQAECPEPRCMHAVTHDAVTAAVRDLGVVAQ